MNRVSELKNILDRIKGETSSGPRSDPFAGQTGGKGGSLSDFHDSASSHPRRPHFEIARPEHSGRSFAVPEKTAEGEIVLFGMLSALLVTLGGVLASSGYLMIAGGTVFIVFACLMAAAFCSRKFRGLGKYHSGREKYYGAAGGSETENDTGDGGAGSSKEKDLEQKVEELRILVKSLAKIVEQKDK